MYYWFYWAKNLERVDSLKDEIIAEYVNQTGIAAASRSDLVKAFETKDLVTESCLDDLDAAMLFGKKQERRKKVWKTVSLVGIPLSFGVGVVGTVYLISR
jgi:hypothetical protein